MGRRIKEVVSWDVGRVNMPRNATNLVNGSTIQELHCAEKEFYGSSGCASSGDAKGAVH